MYPLRARLDSQAMPQPEQDQPRPFNQTSGAMRTFQLDIDISAGGAWVQIVPQNNARRFLMIQSRGGDLGPCNVEMVFDRQNRNEAFLIDHFYPTIAPINAIYAYVSDANATGSTSVNLQVIEG